MFAPAALRESAAEPSHPTHPQCPCGSKRRTVSPVGPSRPAPGRPHRAVKPETPAGDFPTRCPRIELNKQTILHMH